MKKKNQSLLYFKNLYLVALADGKITREETILLDEFAHKMGITAQEKEVVRENANFMEFFVPREMKDRLQHLESLIRMMIVDGEIHEKEYHLCLNYANRSGCDQLVLDMLIEKVTEGKH
ncbi:MAG TPA: hypothetical protein DCS93_00965 [Microscillaceae bacterium]|nr:hypothetical protein [Microscillaceae bacterium]